MSVRNSRDISGRDLNKDIRKDEYGSTLNAGACKNVSLIKKESLETIISSYSKSSAEPADYRKIAGLKHKFAWQLNYKHSDIFISSDCDIGDKILNPLKEIYSLLERFIEKNPFFLRSLVPIDPDKTYPEEINAMCCNSLKFNVGPMAAVAGAVNDYLAKRLLCFSKNLFIENGGDLFIKSGTDTVVNLYIKNTYFKDKINIIVKAQDTPCGICSSSGTFGHSFSMGKCDLATVIADTSAAADAAATAAANSVMSQDDVGASVDYFSTFDNIYAILIVKDKKIGVWGRIQLA